MKKQKHTCNRLLIGLTVALLLVMTGAHAAQTTRVSINWQGKTATAHIERLAPMGVMLLLVRTPITWLPGTS